MHRLLHRRPTRHQPTHLRVNLVHKHLRAVLRPVDTDGTQVEDTVRHMGYGGGRRKSAEAKGVGA